jgi:uncharacterized RDD family membrane protein YckC
MMNVAVESATSLDSSAYSRFTRRLQGVIVDSIVMMAIMVLALVLAVTFASDHVARILGFTVVITWLLYEPLLVSMISGTVVHLFLNMRVVDDRTGGNVTFGNAVLRMVIKTVLGWYSFIAMAVTSRHQAVHDLLTKSTVQIRDLAKTAPHHFSGRREATVSPGTPSGRRRIVVIIAYLLGWFGICLLAFVGLAQIGLISIQCLNNDVCSPVENLLQSMFWLGWLGLAHCSWAWDGEAGFGAGEPEASLFRQDYPSNTF